MGERGICGCYCKKVEGQFAMGAGPVIALAMGKKGLACRLLGAQVRGVPCALILTFYNALRRAQAR